MTLVSKPAAGTGATYLIEVIQIIVMGLTSTRAPLSRDEEERRKVLFTAIAASEAVVLFDNQKGTLDSAALAAALTSPSFTDRVLGRSVERRLPVNCSFTMTSNNVGLSEELQRRISLIRMDAKMPDPKIRGGWRHSSLHAYAEQNRGELLWAVLTLVQNWVSHGCQPPKHCPAVASYPGWCYVLGGILEAADPRWTTFQTNRDDIAQLAAAGEEDGAEALFCEWHRKGGEKKRRRNWRSLWKARKSRSTGVKVGRDGEVSPRSLGKLLASLNGRHFSIGGEEVELIRGGGTRHKMALWELKVVKPAHAGQGQAAGGGLMHRQIAPPPRPVHLPQFSAVCPVDKSNRTEFKRDAHHARAGATWTRKTGGIRELRAKTGQIWPKRGVCETNPHQTPTQTPFTLGIKPNR